MRMIHAHAPAVDRSISRTFFPSDARLPLMCLPPENLLAERIIYQEIFQYVYSLILQLLWQFNKVWKLKKLKLFISNLII